MRSGGPPNYASDGAAFAQMDDDTEEEFVTVEDMIDRFPRETVATISTWGEKERAFEWRSKDLSGIESMVVGNIDNDPLDELVLFGESHMTTANETIRVVQWNGNSYELTGSDQLSGRLGSLLDIDADGRQEIVLSVVSEPYAEAEGTEPATLVVAAYAEGKWLPILSHDIPHGVMALAAGDLDGDGRSEIVVYEESGDERIDGQIVVYGVDPERGIERWVGYGRMVRWVSFLGVFESGAKPYLFVEQGGNAWKSVFRLAGTRAAGFELVALKAHRTGVFLDALRSTMAYSTERRSHARFVDRRRMQLVPVESAESQ